MRILNIFFQRKSHQTEMIKSLFVSITAGTILLFIRVIYVREYTFLFLIWNLFLAYIPLFISNYIQSIPFVQKNTIRLIALSLLWILFFPNAPYIITDYFHLFQRPGIPLWLDLIILTIFAWNGLIVGFISLMAMQRIISEKFTSRIGWIYVVTVLIFAGFGVYIGRYLRYNSWDVFFEPFYLFRDIGIILIHPGNNKDAYGMTIGMSMFLLTAYFSFYRLSTQQYQQQK